MTTQSFLLDAEQELMASQSFLVENEQEGYLSLAAFDFYRSGIYHVTINTCGGSAGYMSSVWQCLLFVSQKLMKSQSFFCESREENVSFV